MSKTVTMGNAINTSQHHVLFVVNTLDLVLASGETRLLAFLAEEQQCESDENEYAFNRSHGELSDKFMIILTLFIIMIWLRTD